MPLPAYAVNAVRCMGVGPGERLLVVVDESLQDAGLRVCDAASTIDVGSSLIVLPDSRRPLREPSPEVIAAVGAADATVLWKHRLWPEEVVWRRSLYDCSRAAGGRIAFGGSIDQGILDNELSADYVAVAERCRRFADALEGARELRVTAAGGTDLRVRIEGRQWKLDDGLFPAGTFGNLPAGEIFIAPLEDSAEGILVVDRSLAAVEDGPSLVDEPVRITFRGGRVVDVQGGTVAAAYRELIRKPNADVIAEVGIGTNEKARMQGNVMTDEKVLGSAHVAVGYNLADYGGVNDSPVHCDGCFADAVIEADGRVVIRNGELVA